MPQITVILLTYNREQLLPRAVDSIIAQAFRSFELIIVDNGSSDNSGLIADGYAEKNNPVRVIHRERGNIGSGRNAGLDAAVGEWIAFIDDDDYVAPDYLAFLHALAMTSCADIAICGATGREYDEKFVMSPEEAMLKLLWRKYYNVQFPTKLIRRRLFDGVRFNEIAKYDDIELFPKVLASANKVAYHGLAKYTFDRSNGDNNSAWTTNHALLDKDTLNEYLRVYHERTEWLCARFPARKDAWQYFEWSFWISMAEKVTRLQLDIELFPLLRDLQKAKNAFLTSAYILDFEKEWVKRLL